MDLNNLVETIYAYLAQSINNETWPDLQEAFEYARIDASKGDRSYKLRVCLPLLVAMSLGGSTTTALPIAASWELSYWAAAVLDDLVDRDHPKRPWHAWPNDRVLPVGIGLLVESQKFLINQPADISARINETLFQMTRGQSAPPFKPNLEKYFEYITYKTGVYFAAYLWAAARITSNNPKHWEALWGYGMAIGILAQVKDDSTWASVDVDLAKGIYTLPVIYALTQANANEQAELDELIRTGGTMGARSELRQRLAKLGAPNYCALVANNLAQQAIEALNPLPSETAAILTNWLAKA